MKERCVAILDARLESKLKNYSTASTGAAVAAVVAGVFALPQFAMAHPVYTPTNQQMVGPENLYQIDLNNDGITDINVLVVAYGNVGSGYFFNVGTMAAYGAQTGNEVVVNGKGFAALGNRGQIVGSDDSFKGSAVMATFFSHGGINGSSSRRSSGPWFNVANRFLGVEFSINGENHYGWLRISTFGPGSSLLTGYAYETEPNTPISCGFKIHELTVTPLPHESHPAKPEVHKVVPSSLGMLAVGAAGRQ